MKPSPISKSQLRLLHSLWNLYHDAGSRADRLRWAIRNTGRTISSFNELTAAEAKSLADVLQLGLEVTR